MQVFTQENQTAATMVQLALRTLMKLPLIFIGRRRHTEENRPS